MMPSADASARGASVALIDADLQYQPEDILRLMRQWGVEQLTRRYGGFALWRLKVDEFPDISISKIRYLEDQKLLPVREMKITVTLDDGSELVVSIDERGRTDLRLWTPTGDLKFPSTDPPLASNRRAMKL